jgi:hypothetical protein
MAKRRKKVGAMDTTTILILVGGAAALLFVMSKSATPTPTVIKTVVPAGTAQANLTAAEIAAGAGLVTTAINDFSSDDDDDS